MLRYQNDGFVTQWLKDYINQNMDNIFAFIFEYHKFGSNSKSFNENLLDKNYKLNHIAFLMLTALSSFKMNLMFSVKPWDTVNHREKIPFAKALLGQNGLKSV